MHAGPRRGLQHRPGTSRPSRCSSRRGRSRPPVARHSNVEGRNTSAGQTVLAPVHASSDIAHAGRGPAGRAGVAGRVLAGVARAVALIERAGVAVTVQAVPVAFFASAGQACPGTPPQVSRDVAFARRRPTGGESAASTMSAGQVVLDAVTDLRRVAQVTRAGATDGAGVPGRMLTRGRGAVALIERAGIAVGAAREPFGREHVGRTRRARAGAGLCDVALPGRRAARRGPPPGTGRSRCST